MAYSDREQAEALIKLWASKYDYDAVSRTTGISVRTLRRWDKSAPKKEIPDLLERAIERLLLIIPSDMTANQWATAIGILMDKWFLLRGKPTSRTEMIAHRLNELPDDDYSSVIAEAEAIIRQAAGG